MSEAFEISTALPADPARIYAAWLDSAQHSAMTGGAAEIDPRVEGTYSAWDGYITGVTLELEPNHRIVQSWRTVEFPFDAPDSRLEIVFDVIDEGTKLTLKHSVIPDGQGDSYKSGWVDNYFEPMHRYFSQGQST
ncbi:MAG: SRPBCC domain-containing protein [Anaerolineae bacterium]